MNNDEIQKFLSGTGTKAKNALDSVHITGQQARTAGAMGQVGGGAGAITGSLIGTGIGLATKHPAQGAGIGAAIGGAAGSSGGAALGLYAGRSKKKKKVALPTAAKQSDYELAKALTANHTGRDAMVVGGATTAAGGAPAGLHAIRGLRAKRAVNQAVGSAEHSANQIFKPGLSLSERLTHGMKAFDAGKKAAGVGETAIASRAAMHTNLKVAGAGAALAGAGALLRAGTKPRQTALAKSYDETKHHRGDGGKFVAIGSLAAGSLGGATGAVMSMAGHNSAKSFEERAGRKIAEANRSRALSRATKGTESIEHLRRAIGAQAGAVTMKGSAEGARALREAGGRTALAGGLIMGAGLGASALMHHHELKKSFDEAKHHRGHGGEFAAAGGAVVAGGGAGVAGHQTVRHARNSSALGEKGRFWREGAGEFGQDASQASKLARANINFAESAASAPDTAHRKGWYLAQSKGWSLRAKKFAENAQAEGKRSRALLNEAKTAKKVALGHGAAGVGLGLAAGGLGALAVHHHLEKSFSHPSDDAQHKLAQGGLGVAALADAAGASAAWKESKTAVKPALEGLSAAKKIKTVAGYAKEKAAFPIVAGGIAATALAEHVMHNQQKAAQPKPPAQPKPTKLIIPKS